MNKPDLSQSTAHAARRRSLSENWLWPHVIGRGVPAPGSQCGPGKSPRVSGRELTNAVVTPVAETQPGPKHGPTPRNPVEKSKSATAE
jgi:hypothetical protein